MTKKELKVVLSLIEKLEDIADRIPRWQINGIQAGPNGRDNDLVPFMGSIERVLEDSKTLLEKTKRGR